MVLEVPRWNRLNTIPTPGLRDLVIPPKLNQPWQRQWPDEVQSPKSLILFHPLHTVKERSLKSVLQRFHFGTASFLLKNKFPRCLALAQAVPALSVIRHSKKGSHQQAPASSVWLWLKVDGLDTSPQVTVMETSTCKVLQLDPDLRNVHVDGFGFSSLKNLLWPCAKTTQQQVLHTSDPWQPPTTTTPHLPPSCSLHCKPTVIQHSWLIRCTDKHGPKQLLLLLLKHFLCQPPLQPRPTLPRLAPFSLGLNWNSMHGVSLRQPSDIHSRN